MVINAPDNLKIWKNHRFEKILLPNPYEYGFRDVDDGCILLSELLRILETNGEIIIISHISNTFTKIQKIKQAILQINNSNIKIDYKSIDTKNLYPEHVFYASEMIEETRPNQYITITQ